MWFACYNLPTKTWTSGGTQADYEPQHYDVFRVPAADRDQAVAAGRKRRTAQMKVSPLQRKLLASLYEATAQEADPTSFSVELLDGERRSAMRLAALGLVRPIDPDAHDLQLTAEAFNPSIRALVGKAA